MTLLHLPRSDAPPSRARALVFEDPLSHELLRSLEQIAPTDATVLITGETGTGKEIIARRLHERSMRAKAPFVAVNCGALAPSLIESELFGHEKAAFTGALTAKAGWFEAAGGGTLFLDEIADLPLAAQVKLLRVLQEREIVRIGARRPVAIDVRLIAATNANLAQAVTERRFREDLFYRLHVAHLTLAPLRDRSGDILPLAKYFIATYAARLGLDAVPLTPEAQAKLLAHRWSGNIRELENAMHHALLVRSEGCIDADDLRLIEEGPIRPSPSSPPPPKDDAPRSRPGDPLGAMEAALVAWFEREPPSLLQQIEEAVFRKAYEFCEHNQLRTARLLGTSRNIVRARLIHHGLLASSPEPQTSAAPGESPPACSPKAIRVRIGHQPFGVLSLLKATRALEDAFAVHGAEVEWTRCATGMQVVDGLAVGAMDLGVVGEAPPVFAQAAYAPLVYLAAEPPAPEGEGILVLDASPIRKVSDLRGKTIAVPRGSNAMYFVLRALEECRLNPGDVDIRPLAPSEGHRALLRSEVDAWAIWNPLLAFVRQTTPVRQIRDARGLASNRAFYVARLAFADAHPEWVDAFLGQVAALGRWAMENRRAAADALAPETDVPADAIETALSATRFDVGPIRAEVVASQQRIADTFCRLGLIARPVRVGDAVWAPPGAQRRSA
jgi:aliphatic sulfonates family ABC transporter substrate-binding protein